jgi:hypothetical protein
MNDFGKVFKIIVGAMIIVVVGAFIGWLGVRSSKPASKPEVPRATVAVGNPDQTPTVAPLRPEPQNTATNTRVRPHITANIVPANVITNWEDRVDDILGSNGEDDEKLKQLLDLFPNLPEEGQVEVAQHLSNLTPDENYTPLAQYTTNAALPEDVLEVFLSDLLNRPNSVKLPMLLEIAQNDQHPKAAEARDLLELFLEEDYGKDWARWQSRMQQWLQDNPD